MIFPKSTALVLAAFCFSAIHATKTTELASTNIVNNEYGKLLKLLDTKPGVTSFKAGSPFDATTQWDLIHDAQDNHHSIKNSASNVYVSINEGGSITFSSPGVPTFQEKFQLEEDGGGFHLKTWSGAYLAGTNGSNLSEVADKSDKTLWYFMELETTPVTESDFIDQVFENAIDHESQFITFETPFSSSPALFAQLMTYNGVDTADLRVTEVNTLGFRAFVQEEQSDDSEIEHMLETFGFMAFGIGNLKSETGTVIGEVGRLVVPQQDEETVHSLGFQNRYTNPVVIMMTNTFVGTDPCHMRIVGVTSVGFDYMLEEWDYLDGRHKAEVAVYMVVEAGSYKMSDGQTLLAMLAYNVNHQEVTVDFPLPFSSTPVMLSQMQTLNGADPSIIRQSNPLPSSVTIKIEEEEGLDQSHKEETVGVITLGV